MSEAPIKDSLFSKPRAYILFIITARDNLILKSLVNRIIIWARIECLQLAPFHWHKQGNLLLAEQSQAFPAREPIPFCWDFVGESALKKGLCSDVTPVHAIVEGFLQHATPRILGRVS